MYIYTERIYRENMYIYIERELYKENMYIYTERIIQREYVHIERELHFFSDFLRDLYLKEEFYQFLFMQAEIFDISAFYIVTYQNISSDTSIITRYENVQDITVGNLKKCWSPFSIQVWNESAAHSRTTLFVTLCPIWYHLYNVKNVKNTHEGVLLLVKLQARHICTEY